MSNRRRPTGRNRILDPVRADGTVHEPSTWLRGAVRRRLAQAKTVSDPLTREGIAVTLYLTEPPADFRARTRWEQQCDRCGADTLAAGRPFVGGAVPVDHNRAQIVVILGLCEDCGTREYGAEYVATHAQRAAAS